MAASASLSSAQMNLGGIGGPMNGRPSDYGSGLVPESIKAASHQHADFDSPAVKGLSSRNMGTYERTTAWAVNSGKIPTPISAQTLGSYINFKQ